MPLLHWQNCLVTLFYTLTKIHWFYIIKKNEDLSALTIHQQMFTMGNFSHFTNKNFIIMYLPFLLCRNVMNSIPPHFTKCMHPSIWTALYIHGSKGNDSQQFKSGLRLISRTHTWDQWLPSSWRGHSLEQLVRRERPSVLFLLDMAVPFFTSCFTTEAYGVFGPITPRPQWYWVCYQDSRLIPWKIVSWFSFFVFKWTHFEFHHTWSLLVMLVTNVFHLSHMHNLWRGKAY